MKKSGLCTGRFGKSATLIDEAFDFFEFISAWAHLRVIHFPCMGCWFPPLFFALSLIRLSWKAYLGYVQIESWFLRGQRRLYQCLNGWKSMLVPSSISNCGFRLLYYWIQQQIWLRFLVFMHFGWGSHDKNSRRSSVCSFLVETLVSFWFRFLGCRKMSIMVWLTGRLFSMSFWTSVHKIWGCSAKRGLFGTFWSSFPIQWFSPLRARNCDNWIWIEKVGCSPKSMKLYSFPAK